MQLASGHPCWYRPWLCFLSDRSIGLNGDALAPPSNKKKFCFHHQPPGRRHHCRLTVCHALWIFQSPFKNMEGKKLPKRNKCVMAGHCRKTHVLISCRSVNFISGPVRSPWTRERKRKKGFSGNLGHHWALSFLVRSHTILIQGIYYSANVSGKV